MTDLHAKLQQLARQQESDAARPLRLNEYLELVRANPLIAASAPERIYDMIAQRGFTPGVDGTRVSFFSDELFDLERPLTRLSAYFESAAHGHETRRRILLL